MNVPEKYLIWRFNRGDCEAVQVIYEKYKHDLLALAVSLLNNTTAAEDVVHDVFVSFLRLKNFRLTGSLKGYLLTCVANGARNVLRANRHRQHEPLDEALLAECTAVGPDGESILDEETRLLRGALEDLPFEQREVVALHLQGGLKFAEIARSQNVSINTVQARYRYGLEKIKNKLNGELLKCSQTTQLRD